MKVLTPDDLAELMRVNRRTVLNLSKQDGFPQSLTGWKKPTWLEEAVLEFFRKKSENAH